jgi:hypothetical protein
MTKQEMDSRIPDPIRSLDLNMIKKKLTYPEADGGRGWPKEKADAVADDSLDDTCTTSHISVCEESRTTETYKRGFVRLWSFTVRNLANQRKVIG